MPAILLAAAIPLSACALDFVRTDSYELPADQSASSDLFVVAQEITVAGRAQNDLFALGFRGLPAFSPSGKGSGIVSLPGYVDNDVWAAGTRVHLSGKVRDHARLLATESISVDGTVSNSLLAAAPVIEIGEQARIGREAFLVGEEVTVSGEVAGDLWIKANKVTLAGRFGGNVKLTAEDIVVMPKTAIAGDFHYTSANEIVLDDTVKLGGELMHETPGGDEIGSTWYDSFVIQAWLYLGALLAGLLFTALFPDFARRSVNQVQHSHWKCLLAGYLSFCLVPIAAVAVLFTLVGIPLSALVLLFYAILVYASKFITALAIGHLVLRRREEGSFTQAFMTLCLGLIALYALVNLPDFVGVVVWCWTVFLGLGGMVLAILAGRAWHPTPPPETGMAATESIPPPPPASAA